MVKTGLFKILIVEDDVAISTMLRSFLETKNFDVKQAHEAEAGMEILRAEKIDLIVLDWMLPDVDGPTFIKIVRKQSNTADMPIIMLTAKADEQDMVYGLEHGADDYLTKPVSLKALHARIKALLRRAQGLNQENIIERGPMALDIDNNQLTIHGRDVKMGKTELKLLHYLMRTAGRTHSRSKLLDQVWGQSTFIEERTVDVHILRLRKILKAHSCEQAVETIRGVGYRFLTP